MIHSPLVANENGVSLSIVTRVSDAARQTLDELIAQQTWAVPGKPVIYRYFVNRAVQTEVAAAQNAFQMLLMRDQARADDATHYHHHQQQRAFFCGDAQLLDEVIASPFGFA